MLAPSLELTLESESSPLPTKTYKLDWETNRIIGVVEGLEAVNQSIKKIFKSERYKFIIYDNEYGIELESLLNQGYDKELIVSELQRVITEALSYDSRILSIGDFSFSSPMGDELEVTFFVSTIYGDTYMNTPFNIS